MVALLGVLSLSAACHHQASLHAKQTATLTDSAKLFNDDLHWGYLDKAATFVEPDIRAAFLDSLTNQTQDIRYTDLQVAAVSFPKGQSEATVTVTRNFYRADNLKLQTETVQQHWYWKDGQWWVKP